MNFVDPKEIDIPSHGTKNRYKTILPSKWVSPWFPTMTFSPALRMYCCENRAVFISDHCVPIHKCIYRPCRKTTKTQCCRTGKCRTLTGCLSSYTLWQHPNHVLKCNLGPCWFSLEDSSGRWVARRSSSDLEDKRTKTVASITAHTILQSLNSLWLGQATWDPAQH